MEQTSSKNNENSTGAGGDASTSNGQVTDFLSTGRTGRRNALPDILSEHAHVTSSDLPARLQALTTKGMYQLNIIIPVNDPDMRSGVLRLMFAFDYFRNNKR